MTDFTVKFNYVMEVHKNLVRDNRCIAGIEQIIHVAYSICANHVFTNGNKRTSFLTLKLLETKLGYVCDWESIAHIVLDLATDSTEKHEFHERIRNNIFNIS